MELEKFEKKQLKEISALQIKSNELKKTAEEVEVSDDTSLKEATAVVKEINAHKKFVSEQRLNLTQPLNNVIKQLIAAEKEVLLPLDEGKASISEKIVEYNEEVERKRKEEEERIDAIDSKMESFYERGLSLEEVEKNGKDLKTYFSELSESDQANPSIKVCFMTTVGYLSDRKAFLEEEIRAEAERKRQAEEDARLKAAAEKQSAEEAAIAKEKQDLADQKRQIEEDKAQIQREKDDIERQKEVAKAQAEAAKLEKANRKTIRSTPKTGITEITKFEIVDADAVDRAWCSPDETKIREAIKAGARGIAGVRIYTEKKVR